MDFLGGPEKFFLSLGLAYFGALGQRYWALRQSATVNHIYSIVVGSLLYAFNFGGAIIHHFLCVVVTWGLLKALRQPKVCSAVGFVFNFGYLLGSYYFMATDDYDLNWTTAHCVLALRLIGLGFDVSDGLLQAQGKPLSETAKERALGQVPGLLELLGFTFHYAGLLIGPQFPFVHYNRYVNNTLLLDANNKPVAIATLPTPVAPAIKSLLIGLSYVAIHKVSQQFISIDHLLDQELMWQQSLPMRLVWITLWGRFQLMMYLGLWKFAEGSGILSGFGAIHDAKSGITRWDRLVNVDLLLYESASNLNEVVASFNINTNDWVKNYIQVRVAPYAGNVVANFSCLFFLAIWHGFHPGYFIAFFTEFIDLEAGKRLMGWLNPLKAKIFGPPTDPRGIRFNEHGGGFLGYTYSLSGYWLRSVAIALGSVPFVVFTIEKTHRVWATTYYIGHIVVVVIFLIDFLIPKSSSKPAQPSK